MKELFGQYTLLCAQAESVLKELTRLVAGHYPLPESLCGDATVLLTGLQNTYKNIRQGMAQHLGTNMPARNADLPTLQAAWEAHVGEKHRAARVTLADVLRIRTDLPRYAGALAPLQEEAARLLATLPDDPDTPELPDLAAYELLAAGCRAGQHMDDRLLARIEDSADLLPRQVVFGLLRGCYALTPEETPAEEAASVPDAPDPAEAAPIPEAAEPVPDAPAAPDPISMPADDGPASTVILLPEEELITTGVGGQLFLHPISTIPAVKLPSEKKLLEVLRASDPVLSSLIGRLCFTGLMDLRTLHQDLSEWPAEAVDRALVQLEKKGYIAIYGWQGRIILCFTPLMKDCLLKKSLAEAVRRATKIRQLPFVSFPAAQDMPLDDFLARLTQVDLHDDFVRLLRRDTVNLDRIPTSDFIAERNQFAINLSRPDGTSQELLLVSAQELATLPVPERKGVICAAATPPDMPGVTDGCRFCLTPAGLHRWHDGAWDLFSPAQN